VRFKKLLVAVDFSEASRKALQAGAAMAADTGVPLVLLHVVSPPRAHAEGAMFPVGDTPAGAEAELAAWKRDAEATGARLVTTRIVAGTPWHEIVEVLRADRSFDLAIVGTHGRTGLTHVLLGSVAERVVRFAPCPVLVVRVPDY